MHRPCTSAPVCSIRCICTTPTAYNIFRHSDGKGWRVATEKGKRTVVVVVVDFGGRFPYRCGPARCTQNLINIPKPQHYGKNATPLSPPGFLVRTWPDGQSGFSFALDRSVKRNFRIGFGVCWCVCVCLCKHAVQFDPFRSGPEWCLPGSLWPHTVRLRFPRARVRVSVCVCALFCFLSPFDCHLPKRE